MPRLFGRLWRSGGRRAELTEGGADDGEDGEDASRAEVSEGREELGRRLEAARQRLRQTIPPPGEPEDPQT
jgi:hypothetical protein